MVIKRGEIWWAELPESVGSGPGYRRPVVIIQSNEFNKSKINTIIVAVITSKIRLAAAPGNVLLSVKKSKLPKESVINTLSNKIMEQVDEGVKLVLKL
jgi:mRNA interferase MazF